MSKPLVDVIVFGATGFTGKCIVEECARINNFAWAVAGRNVDKMRDLLATVSAKIGVDVTSVETIKADCGDPESLNAMAGKGKVIINCAGPYRFYGECVVKACVEQGSHYVDVSGEPEYMEKMQLEYHDLAKSKNCYVVSSCGMDSIPVDIGILHFMRNFDGQVNYVETYLKFNVNAGKFESFINYATWESAVHGFANQETLIANRKKLFSKTKLMKPLPSIPRRPTIHRSEVFENKHSIPFVGSDRSVVVRTQMFLSSEYNLRPVQCNPYLVCNSVFVLWGILLTGFFLQLLTKYEFGRKLLLNYPRIFTLGMISHSNPTEETRRNTVAVFKLKGEGWSKEVLEKCENPKTISEPTDSSMLTCMEYQDPAYGFTAMSAVQCALIILNETEKLPSSGGVYTPGAAFYSTSIIERLAKHGAEFKILNKTRK